MLFTEDAVGSHASEPFTSDPDPHNAKGSGTQLAEGAVSLRILGREWLIPKERKVTCGRFYFQCGFIHLGALFKGLARKRGAFQLIAKYYPQAVRSGPNSQILGHSWTAREIIRSCSTCLSTRQRDDGEANAYRGVRLEC